MIDGNPQHKVGHCDHAKIREATLGGLRLEITGANVTAAT